MIGVLVEKNKSKKSFTQQEQESEKEEKLTTKMKVFICIIPFALLVVLLSLCYISSYNQVSVFTENNIYYGTFYNPVLKEYKYSDIEKTELDYEGDANLEMDLYMENGDKVKVRCTGQYQTQVEEYEDNTHLFFRDLVLQLREDNVSINYKCTFDDVARYCGEEHHEVLHTIFEE